MNNVKEARRTIRAFYLLMLNDLRLGARIFRRHFGLAAAAALALALGIGSNTAIFSVLHSVVLNALPCDEIAPRDPATVAVVAGTLAAVALMATWLPARRAVRISPSRALREK